MIIGGNPFHEHVLHWLWQNRFLKNNDLRTEQGEKVVIHHPGYHNKTDGPDFTHARVTVGSLKWHGDIEIHWRANDWKKHNHQYDSVYNRVVLHVIYNKSGNNETVLRQDGTPIPTLCLEPFLEKPLQYFFHYYQQKNVLPCTGNLAGVPEEIINQQFEDAHRSYFEQKVDDYLQFYDASLPLSKAWQHALITAIFDNLGISHNRDPMKKLASVLLERPVQDRTKDLIEYALNTAGIEPQKKQTRFSWNRKGSRPANRPENRIKQGCFMMHFIQHKKFVWWLKTDMKESFLQMTTRINTTPRLGKQQSSVLFGTVWLPAYYLLGDLTGNKHITSEAIRQWSNHRASLPDSIGNIFLQTGIPKPVFARKLGAVHQYRAVCEPKQCQFCKIFQHIISS